VVTQRGRGLNIQGQGRAYAAVIGVTVGMLVVGLAVPMLFGRLPVEAGAGSDTRLEPEFAAAAPSATPGGPGAVQVPGTGAVLPGPSLAPGAVATAGPTAAGELPGAPSAPGTRLTATDRGVTATTIKLGIVLLDIQKLEPLGFSQPHFSPAEQRDRFQFFIDEVNKKGGLAGRKISAVYATYDALDSSGDKSGPAVCIKMAENEKVFAVLGFLDGNIGECLTQQYGIPAIANVGHIAEAYKKGKNLLVSPFAALERGTANWGDLAARSGLLKGRRLGTLFGDGPQEARPEQSLVNALGAGGYSVAYRAKLGGDPATVQSQLPVEVNKMKAAGVDTVFLVTNFVTALQFANTAEGQNFRPLYIVSDLGSLQAEGLVRSMPPSFDGAYVFTQNLPAKPEIAENRRCRTSYNSARGVNYPPGQESGSTTLLCWMVTVFADSAARVGPELTRVRLGQGFQTLTRPLPHTQPGSFRIGKTDYADWMRVGKYSRACRCYQPWAAPQKGRY
jgi:hypothetical protein